jgi:cell division protein FtsB
MRLLLIALAMLLLLIQWPLWFGKGSWLRVSELQKQVDAQRATNAQLAARNAALLAEVDSLRQGREAIEERARMQLNMVRADEIFFQRSGPAPVAAPGAPAASNAAATPNAPMSAPATPPR